MGNTSNVVEDTSSDVVVTGAVVSLQGESIELVGTGFDAQFVTDWTYLGGITYH